MGKTLFDIMDVSDDCIAELKKVCADLLGAKYILAEKKISAVLQTIAKSKRLYAFISACMKNFDFAAELANAKRVGTDGSAVLVLPTDRKTNIAFVFCLLLSFDTNQTDFKKFLHTFYYNGDSANTEYTEFASAIIVPFCEDIVTLYAEAGYAVPQKKESVGLVVEERYAHEPPQVHAPQSNQSEDSAIRPLVLCVREIIGIVARDPGLNTKEREELLLICEAFEQAVRLGAENPIRTMYIALKNTIKCSSIARRLEAQSVDLARTMQENNLD